MAEALQALSKIPTDHDGRVAWDSAKLEHGSFEVLYNLTFDPPIDDFEKDAAIWSALNECARTKDFTPQFFIVKVRTFLKGLLSNKPRTFTAVTQINAQAGARLPKKIMSVDGSVEIRASLPPSSLNVIRRLEGFDRQRLNLQDDFVYLIMKVKGRNDRGALNAAYRRMKYALGILNMATSGYGVSKRLGFPNAPIGKFLSASPIFLIDTTSRKLGNWQSESYYPAAWKRSFSVWQGQDAPQITKFAKYVASDLARIDFREKLVRAVLLFQEGLETSHVEVALLKFWTAIEVLCARDEREPTQRVVERASSIFDNFRHAAMRLNFIQDYRNRVVHRGDAGDHALLCAQYGSLYLAALVRFFLWNIYKFRKRDQILDFLSLPLDVQRLEGNIELNRTRLKAARRMAAREAETRND
ncbi:hypothetical protein JQ636_07570 [Bradyrhizobium japonicum]|uniref:hypothetical protein n=1 Tax=Bradyrhizobium japonicum TaxID=375 RepID=UPI001BAA66C2|nr:hypothetical protein [Bradyrhizobium japonicum]MBR0803396.1 hypothetical protein [Bradyrhizobium japonicum]